MIATAMLCPSCGCPGCHIFDDSYNTDRLADEYETRSGVWSITFESLTPLTNGLLLVDTAMPSDMVTLRIAALLFTSNTSDRARLVFLYTDDSNYWFVEASNNGTNNLLKLYERASGANNQRGSTQTLDGTIGAEVNVQVCVHSGEVHVVGTCPLEASEEITYSASPTVSGTKCGFEAVVSSVVIFDNLNIDRHETEPDMDCTAVCEPTETDSCNPSICSSSPAQFSIVLASTPPAGCDATIILNLRDGCCYGGTCSGGPILCLRAAAGDKVGADFQVTVVRGSNPFHYECPIVFSSEDLGIGNMSADCSSITDVALDFVADPGILGCNYGLMTCEITAL